MTTPTKQATARSRAFRERKAAAELAEVRGIFAPVADHSAIKALCKLDRSMLARMADRGWSDGDMAEYLTANDIVAGERILKALGVNPSAVPVKTTARKPRPSRPPAASEPVSSE